MTDIESENYEHTYCHGERAIRVHPEYFMVSDILLQRSRRPHWKLSRVEGMYTRRQVLTWNNRDAQPGANTVVDMTSFCSVFYIEQELGDME